LILHQAAGCFPFELQAEVIKRLDIGDGVLEKPGYITPFAWVSRAWCQEIRKRILQRCNIKRRERIHWFMEMVNPTREKTVFPKEVLFGANITVLVFSFVPFNELYYQPSLRKEFCSDDAWLDHFLPRPPEHRHIWRNFWEELGGAVARMPQLITFGFGYASGYNRLDGFHRLSDVAGSFSPTLRNLVLRPRNNRDVITVQLTIHPFVWCD
jgi:hypothetical protein